MWFNRLIFNVNVEEERRVWFAQKHLIHIRGLYCNNSSNSLLDLLLCTLIKFQVLLSIFNSQAFSDFLLYFHIWFLFLYSSELSYQLCCTRTHSSFHCCESNCGGVSKLESSLFYPHRAIRYRLIGQVQIQAPECCDYI